MTACMASVWNRISCSCVMLTSSLIGSMVPISLLAYIMLTRKVLGPMVVLSVSGATRPCWSTGK